MKMGKGENRRRMFLRHLTPLTLLVFCLLSHASSTDNYEPALENQNLKHDSSDSISNLDPSFEEEEFKRASSFFPLRGKKIPMDESAHQFLLSELQDTEDKRSQFFPLRGKKIPDEYKRASYFMPMRGRKDDSWTDDYYDELDDNEKRASSFMPMRGKKKSAVLAGIFPQLGKSGMYSNDLNQVMTDSISNVAPEKRMSSFVPVRGKRSDVDGSSHSNKDVTNDTDTESQSHRIKKRSVSFMPMRGRSLESSSGYGGGEITTTLLEKKKHSFMPMRGRKSSFSENSNSSKVDDAELDSESEEQYLQEKRAASFMPMRGRRYGLEDDMTEDTDLSMKRAQSFMPMRGRRLFYPNLYLIHSKLANDNSGEKRAASFMPMRGRRLWEEDLMDSDWSSDNSRFDSFDKKASSFTPMRGRRMDGDDSEFNPDEESSNEKSKRVSFMPMRGRRSLLEQDDTNWSYDKKSSSFMPMRGRREDHEKDFESDDKRSSSFMPMRGRRQFSDVSDSRGYYNPYPYFMAGIGSSLMSRPYADKAIPFNSLLNQKKKLRINWDSVKRAFHATRGKRMHQGDADDASSSDNAFGMPELPNEDTSTDTENVNTRVKRSLIHPLVALQPQKQYIALKRPMSFFATRGKRFDGSALTFPIMH